jgi:hypothetical protein
MDTQPAVSLDGAGLTRLQAKVDVGHAQDDADAEADGHRAQRKVPLEDGELVDAPVVGRRDVVVVVARDGV